MAKIFDKRSSSSITFAHTTYYYGFDISKFDVGDSEVDGEGPATTAVRLGGATVRVGGRQRRRGTRRGGRQRGPGAAARSRAARSKRPSPPPVDSMAFLRCGPRGCFVWAPYKNRPAARVDFGTGPLHARSCSTMLRRIGKREEHRGQLKGISGLCFGAVHIDYHVG